MDFIDSLYEYIYAERFTHTTSKQKIEEKEELYEKVKSLLGSANTEALDRFIECLSNETSGELEWMFRFAFKEGFKASLELKR